MSEKRESLTQQELHARRSNLSILLYRKYYRKANYAVIMTDTNCSVIRDNCIIVIYFLFHFSFSFFTFISFTDNREASVTTTGREKSGRMK